VKAASDICCTSANAKKVVESLSVPRAIMIPDEDLARNVAAQTKVEIVAWRGRCEVHEQFTAADIRELREAHPDAIVLAHPECSPEVVAAADFCRLDRRHDQVCRRQTASPSRARHRMLDERQRRGPLS
jgi:quinolinate synthase